MSTCCDVAFGPYRTLGACNAQVRLWRLADIPHVAFDVAFGGKADILSASQNVVARFGDLRRRTLIC
jgi:hypothetical protein